MGSLSPPTPAPRSAGDAAWPDRRGVDVLRHVWIPLADGTRLAARIWLPESATSSPVPALLEYIPYRKNDGTAARDATIHPAFAAHGYASVRVDIRGSGDSDGLLLDEYLPQEQEDACEVIAWLAAQPWCNGRVGMFGKSWGGFNALQVAALRPPALRAIITVCSSDDRYGTDVHYMGGSILANEMLSWATTMLANNARPPDPAVVGPSWRESWLERLRETPWFVEAWLRHQALDDYWRQGSVCEHYDRIACPVLAIGGFADPYVDTAFRLLAHLHCYRKAIVGPWAHCYPHQGVPGPAADFIAEAVRWWDTWLRDARPGARDDPDLRVWVQGSEAPRPNPAVRSGRWAAVDSWPPRVPPLRVQPVGPAPPVLFPSSPPPASPPSPTRLAVPADLRCGGHGGRWFALVDGGDLPDDQRGDDAFSLLVPFPTATEELVLLGSPRVQLTVSATQPAAQLAVRLCDVAPDGSSSLVSIGVLNLTHRDGHDDPTAVAPGEPMPLTLSLRHCAYRLGVGHALRLAISGAYWPWLWPSPTDPGLALHNPDRVVLELPVANPDSLREGQWVAPLAPPPAPLPSPGPLVERAEDGPHATGSSHEGAPEACVLSRAGLAGADVEIVRVGSRWRRLGVAVPGRFEIVDRRDGDVIFVPAEGLRYEEQEEDRFGFVLGDPLSATTTSCRTIELAREDCTIRIEAVATMSATVDEFVVESSLDAWEAGERAFSESRERRFPRRLV